jgi:pimeloyl-ACP methyl ester carboxylesterase
VELERLTLGPLPALAGGQGPPLLYLGGLLPVAGTDAALARRAAEFAIRPFAAVRRVLYVNLRTGLPRGITIAGIAAEHAEAIRALEPGPVDVLGVSTGGSIAQQLAADHPELVRRLVLIGTGCRLEAKTRDLQANVAALIRGGRPERALASMTLGVLFPKGQPLARLLAPLASPFVARVGDLSDLAATIEAEDGFDLSRADRPIQAPTLIVAGARDRFYPRPLLEETRRLIPRSDLRIIPRRGHLTVTSDRRFKPMVRAFLLAPAPGGEAP